jgi:hypothetical protein
VDNGIEDFNLLMADNSSLLAERNDFHYHCEDLEKERVELRSEAWKRITDLEARVKSAKAHSIDVAAVARGN